MFCIGKQDNVAHYIEKIPGCSENQFSEKALLFICLQHFGIYSIKILCTIYFFLGKSKAELQSCLLDFLYQEKLKHQ